MTGSLSCVLLFTRSPLDEGRVKHIARSHRLFELIRRRMAVAANGAEAELVETVSDRSLKGGHLLLQRGEAFADRLQNALNDVRSMGYERGRLRLTVDLALERVTPNEQIPLRLDRSALHVLDPEGET